MGWLYKQKNRDGTEGRIWWAKYYVDGCPVRESTGTPSATAARRFLKDREGRVAAGQPVLPRADRVRYEEIRGDLVSHYQATGERGLVEAGCRLKHLDAFFRGRRAAAIGTAEVNGYVVARQQERRKGKGAGAANGTINRELGVLGRMLRLAYESGKLLRLPVVHRPKEAGPRQGFFEYDQYEAVRRHLVRPHLQVATAIAYAFGWRTQSEVLTLERRQLDLDAGTLRLEPGCTKNLDGRVVYLPPDLKALIAAQVERVKALERKLGRIIPFLFPHLSGQRAGKRIRDFRKAWATACREAGVPGRLRHDFRRTAVRNMVNARVPERVAMTITGHRTRSVFDRYHIVSPGDLQDAARALTGITTGITADRRRGSAP